MLFKGKYFVTGVNSNEYKDKIYKNLQVVDPETGETWKVVSDKIDDIKVMDVNDLTLQISNTKYGFKVKRVS